MSRLKNHVRAVNNLCREQKDKTIKVLTRLIISKKEADYIEMVITQELRLTLDFVGLNHDESVKHADLVRREEQIPHQVCFKTRRETLFSETGPRAVFLLRDMLHDIGNSSDSAKNVAKGVGIMIFAKARKAR